MQRTLARIDAAICGAKRWIGADLRLVVLPEYILTGPPWGETIAEFSQRNQNVYEVHQTAIANDLEVSARLSKGQLLKIGVREPYRPVLDSGNGGGL